MISSEGRERLALVFNVLRFRRRGDVTFRIWAILTAASEDDWDDARDGIASTQPLRISRCA
jgi:hypothetical protein